MRAQISRHLDFVMWVFVSQADMHSGMFLPVAPVDAVVPDDDVVPGGAVVPGDAVASGDTTPPLDRP